MSVPEKSWAVWQPYEGRGGESDGQLDIRQSASLSHFPSHSHSLQHCLTCCAFPFPFLLFPPFPHFLPPAATLLFWCFVLQLLLTFFPDDFPRGAFSTKKTRLLWVFECLHILHFFSLLSLFEGGKVRCQSASQGKNGGLFFNTRI